jgi:hypothetical protein
MVSDYCYQFLGGDLCSYSILLGFTCPQWLYQSHDTAV